MEVYPKYFRRLLIGNSPQIFPGISRNVENPSTYPLLLQEMEKITQDPEQQSAKIAEVIDTSEESLFRDFDLSTFMDHFKLDPLARTLLASAFTHVSRPDLRTKGGAILYNTRDDLVSVLANARNDAFDVSPSLLATCALKLLEGLPQASRSEQDTHNIALALEHRYSKQDLELPPDIRSVLTLIELLAMDHVLAREVQLRGPQITNSLAAAKAFLSKLTDEDLDERQIAGALLFMVLTPARQQYSVALFVSAVHDYFERTLNWNVVVRELDFQPFEISKDQFLAFFNALLPIAQSNELFDIQTLWGGQWRNPKTQLSFTKAFLSCSSSELDAATIPRLRLAHDSHEFMDGPEDIVTYAETAHQDTMISLDAVSVIIDHIMSVDDEQFIMNIIRGKEALFLCSCLGIRPPSRGQEFIMSRLLLMFLAIDQPDIDYALHVSWTQDKNWVAQTVIKLHETNPLQLIPLLEKARHHGWLMDFYTLLNGFGLDLAALAHRNGELDLEQWAENKLDQDAEKFASNLCKFLQIKIQDELRSSCEAQLVPHTVLDILNLLKDCRNSKEPAKLDLFACMIHGLFDEFSCFGEYPLVPLATTAVLFGGIIAHGLVSDLTLRIGQEMVLDAVQENAPEASMYKFGLQALMQFPNRLAEPEWAEYCSSLVRIPGLRGTEPFRIAEQCLAENPARLLDGIELPNGDMDDFSPDTTIAFKSVTAEPALTYEEPDEETQEKVVFFFNNVSEQNLKSKLGHLQAALEEKYHQWFAFFLVEGRAKVEPNYQPLYLSILDSLGNKTLWKEVLRETYVSVQRTLNAEATMQTAAERKKLKNLASWLGSLTIARDKPIKHKNISFVDLLIEGLDTQRLLLVIPFTCNVLVKGTESVVFKPPNPWVEEIISVLLELYEHFDITTNQKFDIEKLLGAFEIGFNSIEPSGAIRMRPLLNEETSNGVQPSGLESFEDMNIGSITRTARNPRFDTDSMSAALPDLEAILRFPPATGSAASQARLREIVVEAIRHAIIEIIAPVVERSVTIATIATSALIHKDFARESDEDRVRRAAQQMARQLSGSLALVTCKEPLKMSMTNQIRKGQQPEMGEAFPEGAILMCVNDNLEIACSIVEKQAEDRSMPEIESHIENEINQRRQYRAEHPNESYMDPAFNRWAGFIPDPYKISSGGLNEEQLNIYFDFARQSRVPPTHGQTNSADSGRQLPDILQEALASGLNTQTSAETLAIPHQPSQQHIGRMLPPPVTASVVQGQTNGYVNLGIYQERVQDLLADIDRIVKENPDRSAEDIQPEDPLAEAVDQIWGLLESSPDVIAMNCAEEICKELFGEPMPPLEVEIKVQLLQRLCLTFPNIRKEVAIWASTQDVQKLFNTDVTVPLIKVNILQLKHIDSILTTLIYDHVEVAIEFMSELMDALLLNERPTALRADFAGSLSALGSRIADDPGLSPAQALVEKLRDWGVNDLDNKPDEKGLLIKRQLLYIFDEWTALCNSYPKSPDEPLSTAFVVQLHRQQIINSIEDMSSFLRVCIDEATDFYGYSTPDGDGSLNCGFFKFDCLARLIVLLVKNQGESNGSVRRNKAKYMESILSAIVLIINHNQVIQGERFNQRLFFRLLSSILCDWHDFGREGYAEDRDILLAFANIFLTLGPHQFPGFIYSWLILISHRLFMPSLLKLHNDEGCDPFASIMEEALSYIGRSIKSNAIAPLAKDLYRGLLRIVLVLHHDFPEFLAENHFRLCNAIPHHCAQLHNLVLSAYPSSFLELPNPFVVGLKLDRLQEMKHAPRIVSDFTTVLKRADVKDVVDAALRSSEISNDAVAKVVDAARAPYGSEIAVNVPLLHALVLYIGQSAVTATGQKGGQAFVSDSPQATLLTKLSKELDPEACYSFLSSMAHQLRYPNSHTHYFVYALLHIYGTDPDQDESYIRQQIIRVLLERLHVIKPHPWGLVITMLELIKNPDYVFFQSPYAKASPAVSLSTRDCNGHAK
ncbi:CCR4-NOT transcription complex subunit 1, partial [Lecanoromycetidae sp. Uapishka_2]